MTENSGGRSARDREEQAGPGRRAPGRRNYPTRLSGFAGGIKTIRPIQVATLGTNYLEIAAVN